MFVSRLHVHEFPTKTGRRLVEQFGDGWEVWLTARVPFQDREHGVRVAFTYRFETEETALSVAVDLKNAFDEAEERGVPLEQAVFD